MIEIISHRGYWLDPIEKNASVALARSFDLGFGTETDVRDHCGRVLISHDPPSGTEPTLESVLEMAQDAQPTLAINIKADGLAGLVADAMRAAAYPRWFVFDMSVPDMIGHVAAGNPVYTRMSELEPAPAMIEQAAGVWLDAFQTDAWRIDALRRLLDKGLRTCLVSPELHRRPHQPFWNALRETRLHQTPDVILCTDLPEAAAKFFGEAE